jgi:hypothetical protein
MIGTKGTLKHIRTRIHNVPIVFCPVCRRYEVHYLVRKEYEILAEYANGDGVSEVDFLEYVENRHVDELFANCVNNDDEDPMDVVCNQIDLSLDLLLVARGMGDANWEAELKKRLNVLSLRKKKLVSMRAMRQ